MSNETRRILLVEDEKAIRDAVAAYLERENYWVTAVGDGQEALEEFSKHHFDLVVLDLMLPRVPGERVCRAIRDNSDVPIIMLTAKTEVDDRIAGLDAGADDYLTKPFAMGEFLARIRSMTRRANAFTPAVLSAGGVTLNVEEQELSAESAIRLGSKETKLMKHFMMNAGKALTQEEILRYVWSDEPDVPADIVWMYISFLKEKLAAVRGKAVIEGEKEGPFVLRAMGD